MTASVPTNEPSELRAGLTWQWRREDLSDHPASAWTLTYYFKKTGSSGANFNIVAAADGDHYAIEVAKGTTAGYTAGDYTWVAVVDDGTDAFEIDRGTLKLLPRYDQAANLDDRTHARKVLEAIEAVIENRATKDQQEYSIAGRKLVRMPVQELMALRDKYRAEVYSEQLGERARNGQGTAKLVVKLR